MGTPYWSLCLQSTVTTEIFLLPWLLVWWHRNLLRSSLPPSHHSIQFHTYVSSQKIYWLESGKTVQMMCRSVPYPACRHRVENYESCLLRRSTNQHAEMSKCGVFVWNDHELHVRRIRDVYEESMMCLLIIRNKYFATVCLWVLFLFRLCGGADHTGSVHSYSSCKKVTLIVLQCCEYLSTNYKNSGVNISYFLKKGKKNSKTYLELSKIIFLTKFKKNPMCFLFFCNV